VVAAVPGDAADDFDPAAAQPAGLEVVWLRYATVLGPRHAPAGPAGRTLRAVLDTLLAGGRPDLPAGGAVDVVDVSDVVEANLLAAAAPRVERRVYPVGHGRPVGWDELAELAGRLLDGGPAPAAPHSAPANDLGFRAIVPLGRCLWQYLASRGASPEPAPLACA
jgi:nucleoside-diphosphate-sugar epimerase